MTIISRYITKKFLAWTFFFLLIFIFLYEIIDLFEHLDEFLSLQINLKTLLKYYLLFIPPIFVQMLPVAVLLSSLFVLGYMNRYNEITALKSAGLSLYRLITPLIKLALLFSLVAFLVNELIVPLSFLKLKSATKIFHNLTLYGADRRFYYVKTFDYPGKSMEGVMVLEYYPERTIKKRIDAESASWKNNSWLFREGIIRHFNKQERLSKEEVFKEKRMLYKEKPEDFLRQKRKLETMNLLTLKKYINYLKSAGFHPHQELVELQYRFAFPLMSFFIILLGIPFALKTHRASLLYGAGIALALCLFYYACISLGLALGKQRGFPPFLSAWSANILFGAIGLYLLKRSPK